MSPNNIVKFSEGTLSTNYHTLIESLLIISGWYAQAKGTHQREVSKDMQVALQLMNQMFGQPTTTSPHHLLKYGNEISSVYPYKAGEKHVIHCVPNYYVTYNFEVCTWLARSLNIDHYVVMRIVDILPNLFSHHYLVHCLRHLNFVLNSSFNVEGDMSATKLTRFGRALSVCTEKVYGSMEHPEYWTALSDNNVIVVNHHHNPSH